MCRLWVSRGSASCQRNDGVICRPHIRMSAKVRLMISKGGSGSGGVADKKNRRRNEIAVGYTHDAGGCQQRGHSIGGREGVEKSEIRVTYLGAFTSAPLSMSNLTTMSFPPEQAAWRGSTPSMTELIG